MEKAQLEQHFKKFLASTLYSEFPQSSAQLERNTLLKKKYPNVEDALESERIAYAKIANVIERSDIKTWAQEMCAEFKLSFMSVGNSEQYTKENSFLFLDVSANHIDEYYLDMFERNMDSIQYGMLYLNNPDLFPWTDRKVALLQNLLSKTAVHHNTGEWPLVSLLNKADPNLSFVANFNVSVVSQVPAVEEKKKSWGGFVKSLFSKEEKVEVATQNNMAAPDNMLYIKEQFSKMVQKRRFVLEPEVVESCEAIIRQLNILHTRNPEFKTQRPEAYVEIRNLLAEFPKVMAEYCATPSEHRSEALKTSVLNSTQNILNYVKQTAGEEFDSTLKGVKVFEKFTSKMG